MDTMRFVVTWVTIKDLEHRGFDTSGVDKVMMENIATKMGEYITSCDYWTALDLACEKCGVRERVEKS